MFFRSPSAARALPRLGLAMFLCSVLLGSAASALPGALAAGEACTPSDASLLGYWKFDEGEGWQPADSSGNGNTATMEHGASYSSAVPTTSFANPFSMMVDGADDRAWAPGNNFGFGGADFTVTAFIKADAADQRAILGNFGNNGPGMRGWGAMQQTGPDRLTFFAHGTLGSNSVPVTATFVNGAWHHIAGVYTRTGDDVTIKTYVDGALVGTNTATVGDITSNISFYMGSGGTNNGMAQFNGNIDDVRIYSGEVSAADIDMLADGNCVATSGSSSSTSTSSSSSESSESSTSSTPSTSSSSESSSSASSESSASSNFIESSSSTSSSPAAPQSLGSSGGGEDTAATNGGSRGGGSNVVLTYLEILLSDMDTAIPSFGGSEQALVALICPMQVKSSSDIFPVVAHTISQATGMEEELIMGLLQDSEYCASYIAARRPAQTVVVESVRLVTLGTDGYPVSSNDTWNKCIRGTATLADIRSNSDVWWFRSGKEIQKSCDAYHNTVGGSDVWHFPDDPFLTFSITPGTPMTAPVVTVPVGYALMTPGQAVAAQ